MNFINGQVFKTKKGVYRVLSRWTKGKDVSIEFENLKSGNTLTKKHNELLEMWNKKEIWL
jgi:hypothetical protein